MHGYEDETIRQEGWDAPAPRPRIDAARLWSGGVATAVVAALIALVGVLVVRAVFQVAFSGSREAGAVGDSSTVVLCVLAAVAALAATGLAHLLLLGAPRPLAYLGWIIGLVTTIAAVLPFLSGRPLPEALAQAIIHLVIGMAIGSLVTGAAAVASRDVRRFDATH
ncbi:DUF6069 family protein [Pseudonocardia humida]|uniref:Membrane protein (TIGR04086 family) n=1 Tax=Pseudonocardia humida TaxID=2800819 RepID=A0ABT1A8T3_9PSEU|nr:DUF6069 family protein [Pseudonocardia humida]MCO1659447.1 hypothetical protein [Pseudonocardia humida]